MSTGLRAGRGLATVPGGQPQSVDDFVLAEPKKSSKGSFEVGAILANSKKYIGLFDAAKVEPRVPIANLAEIYRQATILRETVDRYENGKVTPTEPPPA